MDYLQNGIQVRYFVKGEERTSIVYLIDYKTVANNSFYVVNQFTYIENGNNRRPDIILFINGLPLVLMELKSPSKDEVNAENAYNQIRNYMQDIPSIFNYNAICVISDLTTNKAGTITSGLDRFMEWKTKDGSYENTAYAQFDTFYEGMFDRARLLDIIKNFICFSVEQAKAFKILAGYHQYFAVRKAVEKAKIATKTDGKGGVFWHTQGSGKSLSMVFYRNEALDRLIEYDAINGTKYFETLKAFIACGGSKQKASQELYIHRNSLTYRLNFIEDLLDVSLDDVAVQTKLWFDIKIRETLDTGESGVSTGQNDFVEKYISIGQKTKLSAPDFTRSSIEGLKRTVKGAPIIVDDLTNTRFNQHAIETIKNDDFGVADHLVHYPAVVISANEDVKAVAPEVIRRTVICRVQAGNLCMIKKKEYTKLCSIFWLWIFSRLISQTSPKLPLLKGLQP